MFGCSRASTAVESKVLKQQDSYDRELNPFAADDDTEHGHETVNGNDDDAITAKDDTPLVVRHDLIMAGKRPSGRTNSRSPRRDSTTASTSASRDSRHKTPPQQHNSRHSTPPRDAGAARHKTPPRDAAAARHKTPPSKPARSAADESPFKSPPKHDT